MDFHTRNYDAALGRWMNLDKLAELSYNLTPYRYAGNNPIMFADPDGLWEFTFNKTTGKLSFNRQDGDNYDSFHDQTGLSKGEAAALFGIKRREIVGFLNDESNSSFGTDDFKGTRGETLIGMELALRDGNKVLSNKTYAEGDNCFNSSICLTSGDRRIDSKINTDIELALKGGDVHKYTNAASTDNGFDKRLKSNYKSSKKGKLGDVVRFSENGGKTASHASIFLLNTKDAKDTKDMQMFTKNGDGNTPSYTLMLKTDIILQNSQYGELKGYQYTSGTNDDPIIETTGAFYTPKK